MRPCSKRLATLVVLGVLLASTARADLIVVEVDPVLGAAAAGLRAGDVIERWEHRDSSEQLHDPLTLDRLEIELMPFGSVVLIGSRESEARRWELPPTRWGIEARLREESSGSSVTNAGLVWESLAAACDQLEAGERENAASEIARAMDRAGREDDDAGTITVALLSLAWSDALEEAGDRVAARVASESGLERLRSKGINRPLVEAALLSRAGVLARRLGDLDAAEVALEEALKLRREQAPSSVSEAESLDDLHLCAFSRGQLDRAEELCQQALGIYSSLPASEVLVARAGNDLGRIFLVRGDHDAARAQFETALDFFRATDPQGRDVGKALTNLGILARRSGDPAEAEARFLEALEIYEPLDPEGGAVAMLTNNLGAVSLDQGDLLAAEHYVGRALELRESREPNSLNVALYLNNVAGLAYERGDLAKAERLYLRSLSIRNELAPESLDTALSLENLGSVYSELGDLPRSRQYLERSLEMVRAVAPAGADEGRIFRNLGQLAARQGELESALELQEQSLAIRSALSPNSVDHASSLAALADVNRRLGKYDLARDQLEEALAISETVAPRGLATATYLGMKGRTLLDAGEPAPALQAYERSLALRQELIGDSYWEALAWHGIGRAHRAAGEWEEALNAFVKATGLMDRQDPRIGMVEESRMSFRASHADMYRDCVDARVQLGDLEGAMEDLERSRARSFLLMLAQRELEFSADLPPELLARRRRNRTLYDRKLGELATISPTASPEDRTRLEGELAELWEQRSVIAAEVRRLSPELDALERPHPLSIGEIEARLEPGTVLLTYSVGPTRLQGLVLSGGAEHEIAAFTVETDRDQLEAKIRSFREAVQSRGSTEWEATELYEMLIQPAANVIGHGKRLLISPDGPLHLLPFAALRSPQELPETGGRFLVEWRPLHFVTSVTSYARLLDRSANLDASSVVVFADPTPLPSQPSSSTTAGEVAMAGSALRSLPGGARDLPPLEFAREEARAIEDLYGPRSATVYLGSDATEARVKRLSGDLRYVHLACHGVADETNPMSSTLILAEASTPDAATENGLLQSWEVFESVRFGADLVTLSACETALGVDMGGEGLVSLVRAFQYAGANAVLASLWQVADRPTSRLMEDLYRALHEGQSKDDALRTAQLLSLNRTGEPGAPSAARGVGGMAGPGSTKAHPFYWAAFQLYGDPRPSGWDH